MKQICKISCESIAAVCVTTLLFSLVFALLYYFTLISTNTFHILNWIFGVVCFGTGGVLLGMLAQKKALLHASVIAVILFVIALLLTREYTLIAIVKSASKAVMFIICCLLAYTRTKKA